RPQFGMRRHIRRAGSDKAFFLRIASPKGHAELGPEEGGQGPAGGLIVGSPDLMGLLEDVGGQKMPESGRQSGAIRGVTHLSGFSQMKYFGEYLILARNRFFSCAKLRIEAVCVPSS